MVTNRLSRRKFLCAMLIFLCAGCGLQSEYTLYHFDNGDDYPREGIVRIVDKKTQKIGYATSSGKLLIAPQYAFGFPFDGGKAKVTYKGTKTEVKNSGGEYFYWESDDWFFIDRKGNVVH